MKRRSLTAVMLGLSLVLSGCSAIKVSSSGDGASKPANVGINDGESTPSPSTPEATIPAGMTETTVELGAECPVDVSLALGSSWADGVGYDGYRLFTSESEAIITVNCLEEDGSSAQQLVDKARERMFDTAGSTRVNEVTGSLDGGQYWTFHGTLAPEDMRAVDKQDSTMFGVVAGVSVEGRLFKVSVDMLAPTDDEEAQDDFRQMLPTVRLGDQVLKAPDLR